jgi:hypothetical protein
MEWKNDFWEKHNTVIRPTETEHWKLCSSTVNEQCDLVKKINKRIYFILLRFHQSNIFEIFSSNFYFSNPIFFTFIFPSKKHISLSWSQIQCKTIQLPSFPQFNYNHKTMFKNVSYFVSKKSKRKYLYDCIPSYEV